MSRYYPTALVGTYISLLLTILITVEIRSRWCSGREGSQRKHRSRPLDWVVCQEWRPCYRAYLIHWLMNDRFCGSWGWLWLEEEAVAVHWSYKFKFPMELGFRSFVALFWLSTDRLYDRLLSTFILVVSWTLYSRDPWIIETVHKGETL